MYAAALLINISEGGGHTCKCCSNSDLDLEDGKQESGLWLQPDIDAMIVVGAARGF